jgi:nicotinamide riboside transporter PnuC
MIEYIPWILSGLSIIGAFLNARQRIEGFYFWLFANMAWIAFNIHIGLYGQVPMWVFYTIISVYGIYEWRKKGKVTND